MHSGRFFSLLVLLAALGGGAVAAPPAEAPRIVIDPGHGGKDPGAVVRSLREKQVALSLAKKLAGTLEKKLGAKVSLTRAGDRFLTLADRNRVANRNRCDLFLSIHANSSRNTAAKGIETYFLSFASSPEAEAVAARENSASEREMHQLPDINQCWKVLRGIQLCRNSIFQCDNHEKPVIRKRLYCLILD